VTIDIVIRRRVWFLVIVRERGNVVVKFGPRCLVRVLSLSVLSLSVSNVSRSGEMMTYVDPANTRTKDNESNNNSKGDTDNWSSSKTGRL
jgi:hypothetical protein